MKPTIKQLSALQAGIAKAFRDSKLSKADLARLADVDASQVGRIVGGDFKTFSNHVIQICRVLRVEVPQLKATVKADREWAKAEATLKRIYSRKPESAVFIRRMLDAIADLHDADHA